MKTEWQESPDSIWFTDEVLKCDKCNSTVNCVIEYSSEKLGLIGRYCFNGQECFFYPVIKEMLLKSGEQFYLIRMIRYKKRRIRINYE